MQCDLLENTARDIGSKDKVQGDFTQPFRTLHYLGSKLRMLEHIRQIADEEDPHRGAFCDLFSGSGVVTGYLSNDRRVVSVDIQKYSKIICSALLYPYYETELLNYVKAFKNSSRMVALECALKPLIDYEKEVIDRGKAGDLLPLCDFLENASLYAKMETIHMPSICQPKLDMALRQAIKNLNNLNEVDVTATIYFGGIYFSFEQALHIDVILNETKYVPTTAYDTLMASLLSTASDVVNTVGKQFAQPIRPINKAGVPKKNIINKVHKDRSESVYDIFEKWVIKYSSLPKRVSGHEVLCMDYREAIRNLGSDVSIVYADPPYTRDHYSRFYHGLETLALQDNPSVSKTKIGGSLRLSRGLYREDRYQSPFCIKSQAPNAFRELFKLVSEENKILMLSYSPFDANAKTHPRVVTIDVLIGIANVYFQNVKTYSPGEFVHSKLNHTEKHLKASNYGEIIIVCRN